MWSAHAKKANSEVRGAGCALLTTGGQLEGRPTAATGSVWVVERTSPGSDEAGVLPRISKTLPKPWPPS
jgi:hypothetical protein